MKEESKSEDAEMEGSQNGDARGTGSSNHNVKMQSDVNSKPKRNRESATETFRNKVMRGEGESRGDIIKDMEVGDSFVNQSGMRIDSIDEIGWAEEKQELRERKTPMIRISGGNRKRPLLACEIQELTGGYFM